jgi:hypothetical protein
LAKQPSGRLTFMPNWVSYRLPRYISSGIQVLKEGASMRQHF